MLKFESYTTRQTGLDQNIVINISTRTEPNGLTDGLNKFIEKETGLSINPANDREIVKYQSISNVTYTFLFWDSFYGTLQNAGFTTDDFGTDNITKSYYVLQVYDSPKSESQKLLHTGYYNGYLFSTGFSTTYDITSDREFNSFFLNELDLDQLTGNTVYVKFLFFNAKTGKQQLFRSNNGDPTEKVFYFNATINRTNKTYNIGTSLQIPEFINYNYVDKINENSNVIPEEKPVYPTGTTLLNNVYFTPEE